MGQPLGVWNVEDWQRIDNAALWLDHSISAWSMMDTQWHLNEFTAITMLNTCSGPLSFNGSSRRAEHHLRPPHVLTVDLGERKQSGENAAGWQPAAVPFCLRFF
eukprot:2820677-Amphidinium_carterae.3